MLNLTYDVKMVEHPLYSDALGIYNKAWQNALKILGPHTFPLYLYYATHAAQYGPFSIYDAPPICHKSAEEISKDLGIDITYEDYKKLRDYGYITWGWLGNDLCFYFSGLPKAERKELGLYY